MVLYLWSIKSNSLASALALSLLRPSHLGAGNLRFGHHLAKFSLLVYGVKFYGGFRARSAHGIGVFSRHLKLSTGFQNNGFAMGFQTSRASEVLL